MNKEIWHMSKEPWPKYSSYKGYEVQNFQDGSIILDGRAHLNWQEAKDYLKQKKVKTKPMNIDYGFPVTSTLMNYMVSDTIQLAPLNVSPYPQDLCTKSVPCQKGNNPMYVDNDKHIESSKINYLTDRASSVYYGVAQKLPRKFGLADDAPPANPQEAVDRIVAGKYTIDKEKKKFYCWTDGLRWRDPAVKEDKAGYDKALDDLSVVYQDTKDTIAIGTPAEGLAAVKALDAWTPTVGTA